MYVMRNPFKQLNELPDKPRLAVNLIFGGIAVGALRFLWQWSSPESFAKVSTVFAHYEPYFPYFKRSTHPPSADDFGIFMVAMGVILLIAGTYIFFRRGFWWVAEHRSDDDSITDLNLK